MSIRRSSLTIKVKEAAEELGFPVATTERIARELGLLIMAGNRKRIDPNDLPEILDTCRNGPRVRDSINAKTQRSGSSEIPGAVTSQRARATAAKLKGRSQSTSQNATDAQVVPFNQAK